MLLVVVAGFAAVSGRRACGFRAFRGYLGGD